MSHIVRLNDEGHLEYQGLLSTQEIADINEILESLKQEIPQIESDLKELYGNSVLYKYNLGMFLSELLDKYDITMQERRGFWDEIKDLATQETRKRSEGKESRKRSFYEQCYILSQYDESVVNKLSWRQWQDLLDRDDNQREDNRLFDWIRNRTEKIKEEEWREFEKALHLYLKEKDTSVFTNDELFSIYDSFLLMSQSWISHFKLFQKQNPKSAKIKSKGRRSKKYQKTCFELKKKNGGVFNEELFDRAFAEAMK